MTPFLEFLSDKILPGFAMLKNASVNLIPGQGHRVTRFEEAFWSNDIGSLRSQIPTPQLQATKEAMELIHYKFSEEELSKKHFHFEDEPSALLSESNDKEIFGESWTIFWVVRPQKEEIISIVLTELEKGAEERISAGQIEEVWDNKINRVFFRHDEEVDDLVELTLVYEELQEELIKRVNESTKAPLPESWEILNEDYLWSEDED